MQGDTGEPSLPSFGWVVASALFVRKKVQDSGTDLLSQRNHSRSPFKSHSALGARKKNAACPEQASIRSRAAPGKQVLVRAGEIPFLFCGLGK